MTDYIEDLGEQGSDGYESAIAIVGMSGRFSGAHSVSELWASLLAGEKGLRTLTDEQLQAAGVQPGQLADPRYVRVSGAVPDVDMFDASVFGINPREAQTMDPQHRMFLECSWEALEAAGYCPTDMSGQVGVFGGCGFPDYIAQNVMPLMSEPGGALLVAVGNERDSLSSLVSYKLGLRGPSLAVQTFCSTSLVAVHLACQSLLTYECDTALAGGAFVPLPQPSGYVYEQGGILSPDGVVRSFDSHANGTVMGSGTGVVMLKRMADAIEDGDVIHSIILGSAVNNDGRVRAGYTAPGVDGEAEVIELALGVAGVKADSIGYVECHATGTSLGDSIELAALNRVFAQTRETPCVLGTLKPSIGHLDRASGVSGLIRATLNLEHELLPATPNYEAPNQALAGVQERFTVLTEHRPWPAGPLPRRAGVSSFGLGGTNAHVVLEQAPRRPARPHRGGPHLLIFSAVDATALEELTTRLRDHLLTHPGLDLADVAYTLQVSRGGFPLRRAVVCDSHADALIALADPSRWLDARTTRRDPRIRLTSAHAVPEVWWQQLYDLTSEHSGRATPETAMTALGGWLTGHGVRVDTADGSEQFPVAPSHGESAAQWLAAALGRLWEAGSTIDWPQVHRGEGLRVELPTYPFQRRRYWVEAISKSDAFVPAGRTFDRSQWTYLPSWHQRPLRLAEMAAEAREAGPWLVFAAEERGEALVAELRGLGVDVTAVRPGPAFARTGPADLTVRPTDAGDLAAALRELPIHPRTIVHGLSLAADTSSDALEHFHAEQERGFYAAIALTQALVDDTGNRPRIELTLLTSGAVHVVGTDLIHPEHSTLGALAATIAQENPGLRCRHIDVDAPAGRGIVQLARQTIVGALAAHEGPLAVRAGEAWQRAYRLHPLEEIAEGSGPITAGDTVLITGGLGDVGLALARRLAARECNLVLTVRTSLPPREDWPMYLATVPPGSERAVRHIANILALEASGAQVLAMSADVADVAQMQAVVNAARERFGAIDVVVHGAGVQDPRYFGFAHVIDRSASEAHLAAKVDGFHVLQQVLGDDALDRRITLSSVATVLGGMTLGPYAAANAAMDAYATVARSRDDGRWISVNWDTWNIDADRVNGHSADVADFAMTPTEAVDVFERCLAAGGDVTRLVISTGSLDARVQQWIIDDLHAGAGADDNQERHPRPDLSSPFVEPRPGTEAALAEIWSAVLAIEPIGAADNFFELGGHSLIAIDLTHRIRRVLKAPIPVTGLLECPTVRELAALIDARATTEGVDDAA